MAEDPSTRWLKVVDTGEGPQQQQAEVARAQSQGFGIAFAKYNVYVERRPAKGEKSGRSFGEGCNVEACEMVFGTMAKTRERILGGRKCLCELRCCLFASLLCSPWDVLSLCVWRRFRGLTDDVSGTRTSTIY